MKRLIKRILSVIGLDPRRCYEGVAMWSLGLAMTGDRRRMADKLRSIVPDVSEQESSDKQFFNAYWERKRRSLQAFQCSLMLRFLEKEKPGPLTVVDIGDSAGTHMLYLRELTKGRLDIDTISVNLDPRAIEKIKARGLKALHCRAEELDLKGQHVDFFTSFQMVEHLHNPAIFFHRLAKKTSVSGMIVTLPYLKTSRVGLHQIRYGNTKQIPAEEEHIFEFCPEDWTLLFLHSGWRVSYSEISYQYPRHIPGLSWLLKLFWRHSDYEGFWGVILEKDTTFSDLYLDWEE